jgi:hypothetical protein
MSTLRGKTSPGTNDGSFKSHERSAPGTSLTSTRDTVTLEGVVLWTERGVLLTPRHRKPQSVERETNVSIDIVSVTADDAPVGLTVDDDTYVGPSGDPVEFRVFEGELYSKTKSRLKPEDQWKTVLGEPSWYDTKYQDCNTEDEVRASAQAVADEFLYIDGHLWRKTKEPVYRVITFGLGGNHGGGTSLYIDLYGVSAEDDGRPASENYFPADQHAEAIAYAKKVAESRGDTKSLEAIENVSAIGVTGAFKPGSTWTPAPRIEYVDAYEARYAPEYRDNPDAQRKAFEDFKAQLLTVPGAVVETTDVWGSTTKRIDPTKLTAKQASDYEEYVELFNAMPLTVAVLAGSPHRSKNS